MKLEQYDKLCRVCDDILMSQHSTIATKSIPWLHVLNAHPTTQEKYVNIWDKTKKNTHVSVLRSIVRFLKNIISGYSSPKFSSSHCEIKKTDVLIFSHLINENQLGKDIDFYFGDRTSDLKLDGVASQIVLINHLGIPGANLAKFWNNNSTPRIFLANKLNVKEELMILFRLVKESYRLFKCSYNVRDSWIKRIYNTAAKAAISFESVNALRFSYQVDNLIRKLEPTSILTTMEGHAFERLAFYSARQVNPDIKCFGYHHTILFPHQHSIKRPLGSDYDPDIILTAGNKTLNTLHQAYQEKQVDFLNIGIHRSSCPETIYEVKKPESAWNCLVLPDGNISECLDLCCFAYYAAINIPKVKFVIRLHPLNSIAMLISKNKIFEQLPNNLAFSNNDDMQDDFRFSKWALYRGSGASIHSVMAGCRPIYVSSLESISIDPLFKVTSGRGTVLDVDGLKNIIFKDMLLKNDDFFKDLEEVFDYCKQYFMPADNSGLKERVKSTYKKKS